MERWIGGEVERTGVDEEKVRRARREEDKPTLLSKTTRPIFQFNSRPSELLLCFNI